MNREELLARNICRGLDESSNRLDPIIAERLRASRERALRHQRMPVASHEHDIVGVGHTATFGHAGGNGAHPLRSLLAMLALLIGVVMAYYWNGFIQASENEEIDSALLTDDLPPNVYLDKGFQAWLEKDAAHGR